MILSGLIDAGFHIQSQIIWAKNQFILGRGDYHWRHEIIWYGYESNPHYWCGDRTQDTIWEIKKDAHSSYKHPRPEQVPLEVFDILAIEKTIIDIEKHQTDLWSKIVFMCNQSKGVEILKLIKDGRIKPLRN